MHEASSSDTAQTEDGAGVARRLSVWKQRQLHSALEQHGAEARSTMYYKVWKVVLEKQNGGVSVVDFYYSEEARLAAAEGLQEGGGGDGSSGAEHADAGSTVENAAVRRTFTNMSWRRWCKRWWSRRGLEKAARDGREKRSVAAELSAAMGDAESCGTLGTQTEGQRLEAAAIEEQQQESVAAVEQEGGAGTWCNGARNRGAAAGTCCCSD